MARLVLALLALMAPGSAASASSTSSSASSSGSGSGSSSGGHGSSGPSAADLYDCRMVSLQELRTTRQLSDLEIFNKCNEVCPLPKATDLLTTCDAHHSFHPAMSEFREGQKYHGQMNWYA